ncbi:MAG: ABC transporter substrate-binding protein [Acidaminococcaceae bacterium]
MKTSRWTSRMVVGVLLTVAMGLVTGCGGSAKNTKSADKVVQVGVIQLVEHAALDAANKGFVQGMANNGYKENVNVRYDQQNAQADQSNLQNIANRFVNNKVDLICAIATPAAQSMANATKDIPIVGTAITDYAEAKLVVSNTAPKTNVTGTTDMNPIDRQLELLLRIVPDTKVIGVIYNSSEVNSQLQVNILKKLVAAKGLTLQEATVSTVNDIQQAGQSLALAQVDAIYVPTDNVVASAMPVLATITNEAKIPVICGEAEVVKNGALATIGIDYYKLGLQTGAMAAKILSGKGVPATMPIEALQEMKTTVSEGTAAKLGIKLPQDILQGAEVVK